MRISRIYYHFGKSTFKIKFFTIFVVSSLVVYKSKRSIFLTIYYILY